MIKVKSNDDIMNAKNIRKKEEFGRREINELKKYDYKSE